MSPKDSPHGGKLPSSSFEEVLIKICTSIRAYGCLQREFDDAKMQRREMEIKLILKPWDVGVPRFRPAACCRGQSVYVPKLHD
jgi:hypothetical protein